MKKLSKIVVLFLFVFVTLTGCTTVKAFTQSVKESKPIWFYYPKTRLSKNQIAFYGEGTAETERQAQLLAYTNLYERIGQHIGTELDRELYRELTTLGTIEQLKVKVEDTFTEYNPVIGYSVTVFASADSATIASLMTTDSAILSAKVKQATDLILQGDEYIKKNQDLEGVKCYLQSMIITYPIDSIDNQYSYKSIYSEVKKILETITISMSDEVANDVTCTITVKRKQSIIASNVKNCSILASYTSVDGNGKKYSDSFTYTTSDKGSFSYKPLDYFLSRTGSIIFSFDLEEQLSEIEKFDSYTATRLRRIVENKKVEFSYSREYENGPLVISAYAYDEDGELRDSSLLNKKLEDLFTSDNANCTSYCINRDISEDQIALSLKPLFPESDSALILKAGISNIIQSNTGTFVVSIEAQTKMFDLQEANETFSSPVFYSNGFGNTFDEALKNAFEAIAELTYTLVRNTYV